MHNQAIAATAVSSYYHKRWAVPRSGDIAVSRSTVFAAGALALLTCGAGGALYHLSDLTALLIWIGCFASSYLISRGIARLLHMTLPLGTVAVISYTWLSVVGAVCCTIYRQQYGVTFGPYGDDSYYFFQALRIVSGVSGKATLYEHLLANITHLVSLFTDEPTVIHLLLFNWLLGSVAAVLSYAFASHFSTRPLSVPLFSLVFLANATMVDTLVHLYRDGLLLVVVLAAMIAALHRRFTLSITLVALSAGLRSANAFLTALFVVSYWLITRRHSLVKRYVGLALVILCITGVAADNYVPLGGRLRTLANQEDSADSILNRAAARSSIFMDAYAPERTDLTATLYRTGLAGRLAMPLTTIFAPVRFSAVYTNIKGVIFSESGRHAISYYGIRPQALLEGITIVSWVVVAPFLIQGLLLAFKGIPKERLLCVYAGVCILAVTFISFQPRHRTAFLALFPALVAVACSRPGGARWRRTAQVAVCAVLVSVNIASLVLA